MPVVARTAAPTQGFTFDPGVLVKGQGHYSRKKNHAVDDIAHVLCGKAPRRAEHVHIHEPGVRW